MTHRGALALSGRKAVVGLLVLVLALLVGAGLPSDAPAQGGGPPAKQCSDGIDNDRDLLIDYPADPGCGSRNDNNEADDAPQCSDGIDNDADGAIDYPADSGCAGPTDNSELDVTISPHCSDGLDNDCLLYTSPSPRDKRQSRMPSSA